MPNPQNGTILENPQQAKDKFSNQNRLQLKIERKAPLIHTVIGKLNMKDEQLIGNLNAILNAIGAKFIRKAVICTTMSPSLRINLP